MSSGTHRINSASIAGTFAINDPNAPKITDFTPKFGSAGTQVTIVGSNFISGNTTVLFASNLAASPVNVTGTTSISVTAPNGVITGPISVTTTNTNSTASSSLPFTVLEGSGTATVLNATPGVFSNLNLFRPLATNQTMRLVFTPVGGTNRTLQIELPSGFSGLAASNVSVAGAGGSPTTNVSGQTLTISNMAATSAVTVNIAGLTTPDTSTHATNTGIYPLVVSSAGTGTPAPLPSAAQPAARVIVPIANVRTTSANTNYIPNLLSNFVAVEGVASVDRLQTNRGISAAMQSSGWGVSIDSGSGVVASNLNRSNGYVALGTVTQFRGLVQINVTNSNNIIDLGAAQDPEPVITTVPLFTNPPTAVTFQSRVVRIDNLTYTPLAGSLWTNNTNATFVDQLGNTLTVFIPQASTATNAPPTNQPVTVIGVGGQVDTNAPFDTGWQLQPRTTNDIFVAAINVSTNSLTNFVTSRTNASDNQSFFVSGVGLIGPVTARLTTNTNSWQISRDGTTAWTNEIVFSNVVGGALASNNIFVRIGANSPRNPDLTGAVLLTDGVLSNAVSLQGVVNPAAGDAVIDTTPGSLSNFVAVRAVQSEDVKTFSLSASNLIGPLTVSVSPTGFYQVSSNGTFWTNSFTIGAAGTLAATNVSVRVSTNAPRTNNLLGTVSVFGGGSLNTNTVSLQGTVAPNPADPDLTVSTNSLPAFATTTAFPSASTNFTVTGTNLTTNVAITPPVGFEISTNGSSFSNALSIPPDGLPATVSVRLRSATTGTFSGDITAESAPAPTQRVAVTGSVTLPPPPSFTIVNTMTNFVTTQGRPTRAQSFELSASNLTTNVRVTAPADYQVSFSSRSNFTSALVLSNVGSGLPVSTVFVRLVGNIFTGGTNRPANIAVASGAGSTNVPVTGNVGEAPDPTVQLATTWTSVLTSTQGLPSSPASFQVGGANILSNIVVDAPTGYEVSETPGSGYGPKVLVPRNDSYNVDPPKTLYIRIADNAPVTDALVGSVKAYSIAFDGTPLPAPPASLTFEGVVTANSGPFIVADPKALTGFEAIQGGASTNQSFSVGGTNLNDFLNVNAPTGYQVSLTGADGTFSNIVRLAPVTPNAISQDRGLNYPGNPTNGENRGSGFGPWQIITSGNANIFVDNPTKAGIAGMATNSFGLFANPANASNSVIARRTFTNNALATNQVFSFQWGNNFDAGAAGSKGVRLLDGTNAILTINMGNGPATTIQQGAGTPVNMFTNYGTNAISISIARLSTNSIRVTAPAGRATNDPGYTNTFVITNIPTGFEFYARGLQAGPPDVNRDSAQPYFNNLLVTTNGGATGANVGPTNVLVRMSTATNTPVGALNGNITLSSLGATNKFVGLSGNVYGSPALEVNPTNLSGFIATAGTASAFKEFFLLNAANLSGNATVTGAGGFEVSLEQGTNFSNSVSAPLGASPTPVYVRIGTNATAGTLTNRISVVAAGFAGTSLTNFVTVSGTVFPSGGGAQIGQPAPSSITNFQTTRGVPSASQSFIFDAVNLGTNPVVATVSANYEISANGSSGWTNAVTNVPVGGIVAGAVNYVRISGAGSVPATSNLVGSVTLSTPGTNATPRTVTLGGVVFPEPGISVSPLTVTNLWTVQGFTSAPVPVTVNASNLQGPVTVSALPPLLLSANGGATYNSTVVLANSGTTAGATLNVVIGTNNAFVGTFTNPTGITFSTVAGTNLPSVNTVHTVVPRPDITAVPTVLSNFRTVVGNPSDPPQVFNVSGTNLLTNILLAISNTGVADKYEMSTNAVSGWTNGITLIPNFANTTPGPPVTVAQDNASNYGDPSANTWTNGANGGSGFGPWTIAASNGTGFFAGQFLGNPNDAGINSFGTNAFGLYANPLGSAAFVNADRTLNQPLQVGDTFSFQWAINWDSGSGGNKGFNVYTGVPGTGEIINVNNGGSETITFNGTSIGSAFGTTPMTWTIFYSNATSLVVTANRRDGGGTFTTNVAVSAAPRSLRFYASAMQGANNAQPYFNNFLVTRPGAPVPAGGVVSNTAVFVRLKATALEGPANQQIDLTSGIYAQPELVLLDGVVLPKPTFTVTPAAITNLFTVTNTPSAPGAFLVNAANLVSNLVVRAPSSAPAAFEISTSPTNGFTNLLSIPPGTGTLANFPVYVRIGAWPTVQRVSNNLTFSNRFALNETTNMPVAGEVLEINPGDPRPGFIAPTANGAINAVSAGTNGTFYIGGNFTRLIRTSGAVPVTNNFVRVARILADGTVDDEFDPVDGPNENVRSVLFSAGENRLYIGGSFTSVDRVARVAFAALNTGDGSVVTAFAPQLAGGVTYVNAMARQPDGKILVGGNFTTVGGVACANIARLLPDGSLDPAFIPPNPNGEVRAIALQPDGKIVIGGAFGKIGTSDSTSLARLNIDGTFDPTLAVGSGFNSAVNTLAVMPDGSIIAGGQFTEYQGLKFHNRMARVSSNGVLDRAFNYSVAATGGFNDQVNSLLARPMGEIFAAGSFTQLTTTLPGSVIVSNALGRVTQLETNGYVDTRFNPSAIGANDIVLASAALSNGDTVIVGSFTAYDGVPLSGIAVLAGYDGLNPVITSPSFYTVNAGEPVNFTFTSTGPAPITFSATNTNSSPLLPAGVSLAPAGSLSGYAMQAGAFNMFVTSQPASGLPSAPTPFTLYVVPVPVSYESWTKAWFGNSWTNPAVAGPYVSGSNPSGLNNFTIYALNGGNPFTLGPDIAPFTQIEFGTNGLRYLTYTVNRNPLASVNYSVLYSTNLMTPWLSGSNVITTLTNTPSLLKVQPATPMSDEEKQFLRLRISTP